MLPAAAKNKSLLANPNEPGDSSLSGIKFDELKVKAIKSI